MNLLLGLDKGADDYLIKPFSVQELITRIRANIELSLLRRKIILQQNKQEEINQLLLSITTELFSGSSIKEALKYIAEEIFHRLPCERIIIISNEQDELKKNKILALYEDSANPFMEISDIDRSESQIFTNSQESLNNNSGMNISLDVYCDDVRKNVSILSVEIRLNDGFWGWIKIYRPSNSIWLDSEIDFLQQISNQISLAVTYKSLLEEKIAKDIQIKATELANNTKSQILANTSHELRTPLGAIVGVLSSFEGTKLNADQTDMMNVMTRSSDDLLSIINNILDAAKLEAQKITLVNIAFDLLELLDNTIEIFGEKAGSKKIELIIDYDVDKLSRYVRSDPERFKQVLFELLSNSIKFTEKGEIILTISMVSQESVDENNENPTYGQMIKKGALLIELCDTGIGMKSEYIQHAWKSFSQGDMSITRKQDGTGLGLSICKSLVEINGGVINAESQLGKGSKFWFTWNIELLPSMTTISKFKTPLLNIQFNEQLSYILPQAISQQRILIIHPIESMRNVMLKYLKKVEKVDAFDTIDKAIKAANTYKELHNQSAYDIAFINLYENNEEVMKAALELRGLELNGNNLIIIFIAFPDNEGNELAKKLTEKVGGPTSIIYTPITLKKLINQFNHMGKNDTTYKSNTSMCTNENTLKRVRDYGLHKIGNESQDIYEHVTGRDIKRNCTSGKNFNGKCILCVDDDSISLENTLQQVSKLGYSTISSTNGQETIKLIDSEFNLLNNASSSSSNSDINQINSCRISLILLECNLPIMSGFDVSRAIRAMKPPVSNIPIIILTNSLTEEIQNICIELGINDCLTKPLKTDELEKILIKWISKN
ncbi:protein-histidine kinase [Gigaspora margarita]|uniref:Protein-histidine kinase n=1 Tax=Gigaspora margarita TaxID=4874 RepID=A0A8H4ALT2_GIGMA|nr:protein-histidine kinase [Gigaspora margarita]